MRSGFEVQICRSTSNAERCKKMHGIAREPIPCKWSATTPHVPGPTHRGAMRCSVSPSPRTCRTWRSGLDSRLELPSKRRAGHARTVRSAAYHPNPLPLYIAQAPHEPQCVKCGRLNSHGPLSDVCALILVSCECCVSIHIGLAPAIHPRHLGPDFKQALLNPEVDFSRFYSTDPRPLRL